MLGYVELLKHLSLLTIHDLNRPMMIPLGVFPHISLLSSIPSHLFLRGYFVLLQDALFDKLVGRRAALKFLLQAIRPHVLLETLLVGLNAWRSVAFGQDVPCG